MGLLLPNSNGVSGSCKGVTFERDGTQKLKYNLRVDLWISNLNIHERAQLRKLKYNTRVVLWIPNTYTLEGAWKQLKKLEYMVDCGWNTKVSEGCWNISESWRVEIQLNMFDCSWASKFIDTQLSRMERGFMYTHLNTMVSGFINTHLEIELASCTTSSFKMQEAKERKHYTTSSPHNIETRPYNEQTPQKHHISNANMTQ